MSIGAIILFWKIRKLDWLDQPIRIFFRRLNFLQSDRNFYSQRPQWVNLFKREGFPSVQNLSVSKSIDDTSDVIVEIYERIAIQFTTTLRLSWFIVFYALYIS